MTHHCDSSVQPSMQSRPHDAYPRFLNTRPNAIQNLHLQKFCSCFWQTGWYFSDELRKGGLVVHPHHPLLHVNLPPGGDALWIQAFVFQCAWCALLHSTMRKKERKKERESSKGGYRRTRKICRRTLGRRWMRLRQHPFQPPCHLRPQHFCKTFEICRGSPKPVQEYHHSLDSTRLRSYHCARVPLDDFGRGHVWWGWSRWRCSCACT